MSWPLIVLLLAGAGIVAGILAGLLGIGGGIIIVPVLFETFALMDIDPSARMHLAVGTSLATIIPTSIRSLMAHRKKGAVDEALLKSWSLAMFIGVLAGTGLSAFVSGQSLTAVFAVVALLVSLFMAFGRDDMVISKTLPTGIFGYSLPAILGAISAMMGIGGGTLTVPALTLYNYPIHRAVGTAPGFGLIIGILGTIGFIVSGFGHADLPPWPNTLGYVSIPGLILVFPATILAAPWGVWIAHNLSKSMLRRAFALFLFVSACRMIWGLLG
ncbi:MAG: sulfite exporter TauE/SafE family protein [Fimbriimonadaceae bacterium]|nr:sulfite exporter TauE/SafE family protein [Alphaproteobacteria bacterium]